MAESRYTATIASLSRVYTPNPFSCCSCALMSYNVATLQA